MSFLSGLFGKKQSDSSNQVSDTAIMESVPDLNVMKDLFVDSNPPATDQEVADGKGANIQQFLEQDFYLSGKRDGYTYHSQEMLTQRIKRIKADFRLQIDFLVDQKRQSLLQLTTHNIDMDGLSERLIRKVEACAADYRQMIERLEKEKELSAMDEGWVMKPVHDYRDGFLHGVETFNEEKLLASSTGMFN